MHSASKVIADMDSEERAVSPVGDRIAYLGLGALVVIGVGLRALLTIAQNPGSLGISDSAFYILAADRGAFLLPATYGIKPWPAGYPLFLNLLHHVSANLSFVSLAQHALGIATALLLFFTVRLVAPAVWGLLPAAVVLLAGPQIILEHAPLTESLFAFLIAAFIYCAARTLDARPVLWGALAGGLAAAAACVRVAGLPFVVVVVVWLLASNAGGWKRRLLVPAAAVLAAGLVFGTYLAEMKHQTGFGGPALTRGGNYGTPTRASENDLSRVTTNLGRFWSANDRGGFRVGYGYRGVIDIMDTPSTSSLTTMRSYYRTVGVDRENGLFGTMLDYERWTRLQGFPFVLMVLLSLVGILFARGARLAVGSLAIATTFVTLFVPVAYVYFDARYVVPGYGPLALSAAIGAASIWHRSAVRRKVSLETPATPVQAPS
jgi:hypothetical protein